MDPMSAVDPRPNEVIGTIDWDLWMKQRGIYIPSQEEAEKAREQGLKKVHKPEMNRNKGNKPGNGG